MAGNAKKFLHVDCVSLVDRVLVYASQVSEVSIKLSGGLKPEVFELKDYDLKAKSPLAYELEVSKFETELLIRGKATAIFGGDCSICWKPLELKVEVPDLIFSMEVEEDEEEFDLTGELREEVLIELPQYLTCERVGDDSECKVNYPQKSVDKGGEDVVKDLPSQSEDRRWAGLDAWQHPDEEGGKS